MTTYRKTATAASMIATAAVILTATMGAASAATCKKVKLRVVNDSKSAIKLIDIDYWSEKDRKWRSKPTTNRVLDPREPHNDIRSLAGVKGEKIKLRAVYRTKRNGRFTGGKSYKESPVAKCSKGKRFTVKIT